MTNDKVNVTNSKEENKMLILAPIAAVVAKVVATATATEMFVAGATAASAVRATAKRKGGK